jgi:hypothetical protein
MVAYSESAEKPGVEKRYSGPASLRCTTEQGKGTNKALGRRLPSVGGLPSSLRKPKKQTCDEATIGDDNHIAEK